MTPPKRVVRAYSGSLKRGQLSRVDEEKLVDVASRVDVVEAHASSVGREGPRVPHDFENSRGSSSSRGLLLRRKFARCLAGEEVTSASVDLERGVLDLRVLLHRVDRHVLAVAGLLVAAVRHLRGDRQQVVVHPHRPELEPAHRVQRASDVTCPDRRRQPVRDVVRPADRLVIVREAVEVFANRLDGITLSTSFAAQAPAIRADAPLLRSVIVNLIDNAAEALESSSVKTITVETRSKTDLDSVEIIVSDTGHGISPQDKDKLFLPHFSTKDRGTGLGLAIAARIVAEHGGGIRVEDNFPVGSRFILELPADVLAPADRSSL